MSKAVSGQKVLIVDFGSQVTQLIADYLDSNLFTVKSLVFKILINSNPLKIPRALFYQVGQLLQKRN